MAFSVEGHRSPHYALGVPDPEWAAFYEKHASAIPVVSGTAKEMRAVLHAVKAKAAAQAAPIDQNLMIKDEDVSMADGHTVTVRVYKPTKSAGLRPGMLFMHGGGWTIGDLDSEDATCREICLDADMIVISVGYRLAPEHPYPAGLNDSWNSLLWVKDHAEDLGINKAAISVGGSSAGANIAAVLAHRARDVGFPLRGQILRAPAVCHPRAYPPELNLLSMEDLKDAPVLSGSLLELFYQNYAPPNPADTEVSPLLKKNFKSLAPLYVQVSGLDPLRDEGLAYAEKAKQAGVNTKLDVYPGLPHSFGLFPALSAASKLSSDFITSIKDMNEPALNSEDNSTDK